MANVSTARGIEVLPYRIDEIEKGDNLQIDAWIADEYVKQFDKFCEDNDLVKHITKTREEISGDLPVTYYKFETGVVATFFMICAKLSCIDPLIGLCLNDRTERGWL